jgi:hypothetical protein
LAFNSRRKTEGYKSHLLQWRACTILARHDDRIVLRLSFTCGSSPPPSP